jgi:hypothetical protein
MFFAEISGSAVADVAALGSILIPAMKSKGYPAPFAAAAMSSAATLAVIIPPSIPMILYAVMAESSVVSCSCRHRAGRARRLWPDGMRVLACRALQPAARGRVLPGARCCTPDARRCGRSLLPIIILGGIFGGVVTATEGAALAVVAALFVGLLIYRELDWRTAAGVHRRRRADRGGDAARRDQRAARHLPDRGAGAAATRAAVPRVHAEQVGSAGAAQLLFLLLGMFLHSAAAIILVVPVGDAAGASASASTRCTSGSS